MTNASPAPSAFRAAARSALLALLVAPLAAAELDLASYLRLDGTQLDLRGAPVTDSDLASLHKPEFSSVHTVLLARTEITNAALGHLRSLQVGRLDLFRTQISDDGLKWLRSLPLRHLVLTGTRITDDGLQELASSCVELLELSDTSISRRGLTHLAGLPIRRLDLSYCALQDEDLAPLRNFSKLAALDLSFTRISNGALTVLQEVTGLKELYLLGIEISGKPLEEFRAARPDVKVYTGWPTR